MLPIEPVEHYKDMRKELQYIMYQQQLHSKNKSVRWDILNVKFSFSWTKLQSKHASEAGVTRANPHIIYGLATV